MVIFRVLLANNNKAFSIMLANGNIILGQMITLLSVRMETFFFLVEKTYQNLGT